MDSERKFNIIDEIQLKIKQQKVIDQVEAQRDMTYDEYMFKYLDHIEGRADYDAERNRPVTAEGNESKEDTQRKNESKIEEELDKKDDEENKGINLI